MFAIRRLRQHTAETCRLQTHRHPANCCSSSSQRVSRPDGRCCAFCSAHESAAAAADAAADADAAAAADVVADDGRSSDGADAAPLDCAGERVQHDDDGDDAAAAGGGGVAVDGRSALAEQCY